jgi:predicted nucleic acid-binding protein
LDRGELETLALAHRHRPAFVLIDEYWGRKIARQLELPVCGSLGVLISAYRKRFVDTQQLHLYFSEMLHRQDIWINPRLIERLSREIDDTSVISPMEEL